MGSSCSPFLISLLLILFPLLLLVHCVSSVGTGFSIKLIHSDSIESPLYPGNLSMQERFSRFHKQTQSRMRQLMRAKDEAARGHIVHPSVETSVGFGVANYMALVGIGTFPGQNPDYLTYYLLLDTGADSIWTQCQGCKSCFSQRQPYYPYMNSASFAPRRCKTNADCLSNDICSKGSCFYKVHYLDGAISKGAYAEDRFTVLSKNGGTQTIGPLGFGCGLYQENWRFPELTPPNENEISGILGMGTGERTLVSQLHARGVIPRRVWSMCLQNSFTSQDISTYLRFGNDAKFNPKQQPQSTPLLDINGHYYLNLLHISVGDVALEFPTGTFEHQRDKGTGGVLIDTGSPLTIMQPNILEAVREELRHWYSRFPELEEIPDEKGERFCYRGAGISFNSYDTITLHFENADMKLYMSQLYSYYASEEMFCLAIVPAQPSYPFSFLLGSAMLTNQRFVFDLDG